MTPVLTLLLLLGADPQPATPKPPGGKLSNETPRRPHPLAPSLPELTEDEEKRLDRVIDRFIEADTGRFQGPGASKALEDFKALGPESFFALIRGLNKSASIDHSCPALTIARKLNTMLRSSNDAEMLQYARENVGVGVKRTRHGDTLNALKLTASRRLSALQRDQ